MTPYGIIVKIAGAAAVAVALVWFWSGWSVAATERDAARTELAAAVADLEMVRANSRLAMDLMSRATDRANAAMRQTEAGLKEIRDAKTKDPIPAVCAPVLRPLDVALERMRAEESRVSGGGSAAPVEPGAAGAAGQG